MKMKTVNKLEVKEYIVQLDAEDEALLLDIGRKSIIQDDQACINHAIQKLLSRFMNESPEDVNFKPSEQLIASLRKESKAFAKLMSKVDRG